MVKIRLMRKGATKRPAYRVVVADSRSPRDGRFIENIGRYQPLADPSLIEIDEDRALYWLSKGAQPTSQVANLLRIQGIWEKFQAARPGGEAKAKATAKVGGRAKERSAATADRDTSSGSSES
jgi:small subunit ribosomal protein S16